jgi:hypothetical protein
MLNNSKKTVFRPGSFLHRHAERILDDKRLQPNDVRLVLWMLKQPPTWRFIVKDMASRRLFGSSKKIHASLKRLRTYGYVAIERDGRDGGGTEAGIYLVDAQPREEWMDTSVLGAVDNLDAQNPPKGAPIGEGNIQTGGSCFGLPGRDNSIVNPNTDTGLDDVEKPVCQPLQADGRSRSRKSYLTGKTERRAGGAKSHLPQTEPRKGAAKGSAMKGLASGEGDRTSDDRYTERLIDQMISVASFPGSRMPNPRKAARSIASLIQWRAGGFDFTLDVLKTIADVCSRVSDPDKPIVSWHYFTGAIRDEHLRRTRPASRPQAAPRKLEGWTPAGSAFSRRQ